MPFHTCMDMNNKEAAYASFKNMFKKVVDKHAPMKSKRIRGTHAPFMNKEFSKAIMHRSKLKNIQNKTKTKESWEAFKRQRNKCVAIRRRKSERISHSYLKTMASITRSSSLPSSLSSPIKALRRIRRLF